MKGLEKAERSIMEVKGVYDDAPMSKHPGEIVAELIEFGSSIADGWDRLCTYSRKIGRFIDLFVDFAYEASEMEKMDQFDVNSKIKQCWDAHHLSFDEIKAEGNFFNALIDTINAFLRVSEDDI